MIFIYIPQRSLRVHPERYDILEVQTCLVKLYMHCIYLPFEITPDWKTRPTGPQLSSNTHGIVIKSVTTYLCIYMSFGVCGGAAFPGVRGGTPETSKLECDGSGLTTTLFMVCLLRRRDRTLSPNPPQPHRTGKS